MGKSRSLNSTLDFTRLNQCTSAINQTLVSSTREVHVWEKPACCQYKYSVGIMVEKPSVDKHQSSMRQQLENG